MLRVFSDRDVDGHPVFGADGPFDGNSSQSII